MNGNVDTCHIKVPQDPKRWTKKNVRRVLRWVLKTFGFEQNTKLSLLWHCTGYELITMDRDSLIRINEYFGIILWQVLRTLITKSFQPLTWCKHKTHNNFGSNLYFIWQFCLDLLVAGIHQDVISWVSSTDNKLYFKIHDPKKLGLLWRIRKNQQSLITRACICRMICHYYHTNPPYIFKHAISWVYKFVNLHHAIQTCQSVDWYEQFTRKVHNTPCESKKNTLLVACYVSIL